MTVYFHGSFGLNREYMSGVLASCLKNPKATGDEIAKPFGYKAPFTGRYKSWLHKAGIVASTRSMSLTPMGEVVWNKDPEFESLVTQWFVHHELCTDPERAEAWHFFAREFIQGRELFSTGDLEMGLAMKLMPHHPSHFGQGAPMIKVIARKIIQCYTEPEALGALGILSATDKKTFVVHKTRQLGPWKSVAAMNSAYK
jgi:hypothetical protein